MAVNQRYQVDEATVPSLGEWQKQYDFQPDQISIVLHTAPTYGLKLYVAGSTGGAGIPLLSQGPFIVPGVQHNQQILIASIEPVAIVATVIAQSGYPATNLNAPAITKGAVTIGMYQTLVDGAVVDWDVNGGSAQVTIAGNRTLNNPTNAVAGNMYFLLVIQDGVGNRQLTWGAGYRFEGGVQPTLSSLPGQADLFEFMFDGSLMYCQRMTRDIKAVWSPLSIPQCKVWLDASQLVGLADGDPIASWTDMSGLANHFLQATAALRPKYKTGILNGLPVVRFDGADDYMAETTLAIAVPITVFAVMARNANPGAGGFNNLVSNNVANRALQFNGAAPYQWSTFDSIGQLLGLASVIGVFKLQEAIVLVASFEWWLNGANQGSDAGTWTGNGYRLGASTVPSNYLNGDIAEVLIYGSQLSVAQRQAVEGYIRAKYALW